MTSFDIYLFTRLDIIRGIGVTILVVMCIVAVVLTDEWDEMEDDTQLKVKRIGCRVLFPWVLFSLLLLLLVPSTKEAAAIYLLPKIANNQNVQQIPDKAMQLLNGKLDEWLNELRGKEKE